MKSIILIISLVISTHVHTQVDTIFSQPSLMVLPQENILLESFDLDNLETIDDAIQESEMVEIGVNFALTDTTTIESFWFSLSAGNIDLIDNISIPFDGLENDNYTYEREETSVLVGFGEFSNYDNYLLTLVMELSDGTMTEPIIID